MTIEHYIQSLKTARKTTYDTIKDVDINLVAHLDSGWRIKDILLHLSWVDNEVCRIINAFNADEIYKMPDEWMVRDINDKLYEEMKHYGDERTMLLFKHGFDELIFAYQRISQAKLDGVIHAPWGVEYDLEGFTKMTTDHEAEHRGEIIEAIKRTQAKSS